MALVFWFAIIVASGAGWNPLDIRWSFTNTGAFGDSFGTFSALMASVAAISAVAAFQDQRAEIVRSKNERATAAETSAKATFEGTFFRLVELHLKMTENIDIVLSGKEPKGAQDAFAHFVYRIKRSIDNGQSVEISFNETYNRYVNDLAHYFRLLYQIICFVDQSDVDNKSFYIKIITAVLSEGELIMLSLNCAHGMGRNKFKPLAEQYSLLSNISRTSLDKFDLLNSFDPAAFR